MLIIHNKAWTTESTNCPLAMRLPIPQHNGSETFRWPPTRK